MNIYMIINHDGGYLERNHEKSLNVQMNNFSHSLFSLTPSFKGHALLSAVPKTSKLNKRRRPLLEEIRYGNIL